MTFFVKCNSCGEVQEADEQNKTFPCNPINPKTGERWYSRTNGGKTEHVCCKAHIKEGLIFPV